MVAAQIWEDPKTTGVASANLTAKKSKNTRRTPKELNLLLDYLGFLKRYLTEAEKKPLLDKTPNTICKHNWPFIRKLQALKHENIVFPSDEEIRYDIWVMYVDGVNCMTCERRQPDFYRDNE